MDAKDAELSLVLELLTGEGRGRLVPHPELAKETVTFAATALPRASAVRWLCRTCGLTVVPGTGGSQVVVRAAMEESVVKSYNVARLVATEEGGGALARFVEAVFFTAWPNRQTGAEGDSVPRLGVKWERGRLKVLAPPMGHREVVALLQTMARADKDGDVEALDVDYTACDLGVFRPTSGAEPPPMKGDVSVHFADTAAAEAARTLTCQGSASFYPDPGDPALAKATVTLEADDQPLATVAQKVTTALGAELFGYDGAWLLVRAARRPIYESLVVRVYNVSGGGFGRPFADLVERRAQHLRLPEGLPCAMERVGERFLASMPGPLHKQFADILRLRPALPRRPSIPRRWRRELRDLLD